MKKMAVIATLIVLSGCAPTMQQVRETPRQIGEPPIRQGCIRRPFLGVSLMKLPDGQIQVYQLIKGKGWPAEKAGIRKGDIIKAIDGHYIKERIDLLDLMDKKELGDRVLVTIQRNGTKVDFDVEVGFGDVPPDGYALQRILWEDKKVSLAVLTGEIHNLTGLDEPQLEQWKKATRSYLLAESENYYLNAFKLDKNFFLVDRERMEEVLGELKFGISGVVSEELRAKLGEILGATHLLVIEFTRYRKAGGGQEDVYIRRLIEVETGRVLANVIIKERI